MRNNLLKQAFDEWMESLKCCGSNPPTDPKTIRQMKGAFQAGADALARQVEEALQFSHMMES